MRAVYFKTLAFLVTGLGLFTSVFTASAQLTTVVPAVGTTWRYTESDVSAEAWITPLYDDSGAAWVSGPSGFAYETGDIDVSHTRPPATTLIRTTLVNPANDPAATTRHAEYFRTKFTWAGPTANASLVLHTRWDDSGVIYLNGQVVFNNTGATPPLGYIAYTRGAIGSGTEGTVDEAAVVDVSSILVAGENVLAAELHQVNNTSSDRVFVCEAGIGLPTLPAITNANQPADRIVLENRSTTLIVQATGFPDPTYQWFFNGGPITDATNSTFTITNMLAENAGDYYVTVSNPAGSVSSRTAIVGFTTDSVNPHSLGARQAGDFFTVVVDFDEAMDPTTAEDGFNWEVFDSTDTPLGVVLATLTPNGMSVTLKLKPESEGGTGMAENAEYYVAAAGSIADLTGNNFLGDTNIHFRSWVRSNCGGVFFEVFDTSDTDPAAGGTTVALLLAHANYPNNPRETYHLDTFSTRNVYTDDSHNAYGGRLRATFIPDTTANWVFYIISDDSSQFYLNPTGPGANGKILVQQETGCCNPYSAHATAPYPMVAGQGYYMEVLYKEGIGGDYCHVYAAPQGVTPALLFIDDPGITANDAIPGNMLGAVAAPAGVAGTFTITQQPMDVNTTANSTATFTVGTSTDSLLCYQWMRDGTDIPDANARGPQYKLTATAADTGARFSVRVSILGGPTLTSTEATLTVGADTTRPTVVSVVANSSGTSLTVTYSEPMGPSAATPGNYTINGTPASSATLNGSATVATVVPASPLQGAGCTMHQVRISGVSDQAAAPNLLNPDPTSVSLSVPTVEILPLGATWKYSDSGTDLGTSWRDVGFNDTAWPSGPAPLGFEPGTPQFPPVATPISDVTTNKTAYFRTHFNLAVAPSSVLFLQLNELVDDGAVYYLNGTEVHRSYMPPEPAVIDASTLATGGGPEPTNGTHTVVAVNIPKTGLVTGDNVLAVELHPSSLTSSDSEFAVQVSIVSCLPSLTIQHVGSQVRLTWNDAAYRLETASTPNGPWSAQAGASGLMLTSSTGNAFFRLVTP